MNKADLIERIARDADLSQAGAGRALEVMMETVKSTLKRGGSVNLVGFGSFTVTKRVARDVRNPRTGETLRIKARKAPKFNPGKGLKDTLN